MAYNIRYVIDVANKLQAMPPSRKTFGYALGLAKGSAPEGQPLIMGPFTSAEGVAEVLGSNAEVVKQASTYFQGGWFGKPYEFYVAYANTETVDSLPQWSAGQAYQEGDKVQNLASGYICTFPHVSSGSFSTNLWNSIPTPEEPDSVEAWMPSTQYAESTVVRIEKQDAPSEYDYYQCVFAHTSGESFQATCWESYVPTGKPISDWMLEILQSSANYYTILPTKEFSTEECVSIAGAVEAASQPKTCMFMYSGSDAYTQQAVSDLGYQLQQLSYNRSMVIYDAEDEDGNLQYISAAVSSCYATVAFTSSRPSIVMADKPLTGVSALDLMDSVYSVLKSKNYNFYTKTTDIETNMFIDARMASGQFFDTIQAADWFAYNMKYKLVMLVQSRDKIPFTEDGLAIVKQTISETCVEALNSGVIGTGYDEDGDLVENGYAIQMPELADISKEDKAQRILRDVTVTLLLAGAVQTITVTNDIQL